MWGTKEMGERERWAACIYNIGVIERAPPSVELTLSDQCLTAGFALALFFEGSY